MDGGVVAVLVRLSHPEVPMTVEAIRLRADATSLGPMVRLQLSLLWQRPAGSTAAAVALAAGAWAGITPAGLQGLGHGLGVLGGITQGLNAAIGVLPVLLPSLIIALAGEPPLPNVAEAQALSGQDPSFRRRAELLAALASALLTATLAIPAAVVVGVGDAVRQGGGWLSAPPEQIGFGALAAAVVIGVEASALLVWTRRRSTALATLFGLVVIFVVALSILETTGSPMARNVASLTPFGAVWSRLIGGDPLIGLPMSAVEQAAVTAGWGLLAVVVLLIGHERWWSRGAGGPPRAGSPFG